MNPAETRWIAVDWGTSTLRAWALSGDDTVLQHATSPQGMATVATSGGEFESALLELITPWLPNTHTTPVIACGMVGAKQGWHEVPYSSTPCSPSPPLHRVPTQNSAIEVHIVAGVSQSAPPDVMRGEETQIAGLLHSNPIFQGTVCLPGTHSKWASIANGKIQHFQTYLTGELFDLLANQSILHQTTAPEGFDQPEFLSAFHATFTAPQNFLAQAFSLRPAALLHDLTPIASRSRLSGHLIGLELAGAEPPTEVALIGSPALTAPYKIAIESTGTATTVHDPTQATLDGLRLAFNSLNP